MALGSRDKANECACVCVCRATGSLSGPLLFVTFGLVAATQCFFPSLPLTSLCLQLEAQADFVPAAVHILPIEQTREGELHTCGRWGHRHIYVSGSNAFCSLFITTTKKERLKKIQQPAYLA